MHLTYTRSYWIDLCRDTLGRDLHHNPTKGGDKEAAKFDGFYTLTHQLYTEYFGDEPPADIWQDNQQRFTEINFRRVNVGRYWIIDKRAIQTYTFGSFTAIILLEILVSKHFGEIVIISVFVFMLVYGIVRGNNQNKGGSRGGGGCSSSGDGGWFDSDSGHGHGHHGGDSGCGSGCSGCSSGCSGCGGGGD